MSSSKTSAQTLSDLLAHGQSGLQIVVPFILGGVALATLSSCGSLPEGGADARQAGAARNPGPTPVDVAIARPAPLSQVREYTGTTQPLREVSLRAQIDGQVLRLTVDVGDRIRQGQTLVQIDDAIPRALVANAEAELAARQSEVSRLKTQVSEATTRVEQARLQLQQAEADAARLEGLAQDGVSSQQRAEQARTEARTAAQVLRSAQEQVRNQQEAIVAAERRVNAQRALVAQARERRSYAMVNSPLTGSVIARTTEIGNLVQPGTELLKLGDFSQAKVTVQVSELELTKVRLGGKAQVRLDALPNQKLVGTVTRVSPAADPTSHLVPIEVTIPNSGGKIGSGLLARVSFEQPQVTTIVVPLTALQSDRTQKSQKSGPSGSPNPGRQGKPPQQEGLLFVINPESEPPTVISRSVKLGNQGDGRVEILSGLKSGERFVVRSGRPLKDGETIKQSILSEQ
ncbi:efflux RND transporter periplasmic adaptor subunit [Leptothermofonsia sichuanensis E412]|uniref:efflux RND transporter periplasmic adaptor subunit n=1 Tax=Leptothermofonsia sichuanensis TaxID=2917832 RepID=UPI001CA6A654|nr:efflux RND transporter periplasmic adaptor subunit [Leptothermofonsia sichuanensis]QZZ20302.1 efflux RND transporter periplasmic adaptor subunit [Leptothermofonsia sichuanensis E412]